jgi:hypothetical protein
VWRLVVGLALCLTVSTAEARPVKIYQGTTLKVRLLEDINSKDLKLGQQFQLEVADYVLSDKGEVLIAKGARAFGEGGISNNFTDNRQGRLHFQVKRVYAIDETPVSVVTGYQERTGKSNRTGAAVGSVFLGGVGRGLFKGKSAKLKKGTEIECQVAEDVTIQVGPKEEPVALHSPLSANGVITSTPTASTQFLFTLKGDQKITGSLERFENGFYIVATGDGWKTLAHETVITIAPASR